MPDHLAFGLRIRSNLVLPGLAALEPAGVPDLELTLGAAPAWGDARAVRRYKSEAETGTVPTVVAWSLPDVPAIRLDYAEGIRFFLHEDGREAWGCWDAPLTLADAMTFVIGPVLGYALRARGFLALHASAAVIDGVAVGFIGPGGAGKSTIVAACAQSGFPVLTDDILVAREAPTGWSAVPAPDQVRLWEDSAAFLFGPGHELDPLTPNWPKRGLGVEAAGLPRASEAAPLGALFLLGAREAGGPRLEELRGTDVLLGLVMNTYTSYLLDPAQRAVELGAVGRLAAGIPVRRLVVGTDPRRLPATVSLVRHDVTTGRSHD